MQSGIQILQYGNSQRIQIYKLDKSNYFCQFNTKVNQIFSRGVTFANKGIETSIYENKNIIEQVNVGEIEVENKKMKIGGTNWHTGISLNGEIYSIRVYNRALTQEEINQNYEIDKIRFNIK